MFDAPVNNWVSGSVGVTRAPLRTLCADFYHWRSSSAGGKEVSTNYWLKHRNPNVERCNDGLSVCVAVPEEPVFLWTQRDRAGSAMYEHILLGSAGMSESVLDFVISIQSWSDLEGN